MSNGRIDFEKMAMDIAYIPLACDERIDLEKAIARAFRSIAERAWKEGWLYSKDRYNNPYSKPVAPSSRGEK